MNQHNTTTLTENDILKAIVETSETVWNQVFENAQKILGAINRSGYDYKLVNHSIDPSVEEVVIMLKKMVSTFDSLNNILPLLEADKAQIYNTERILLNSKQTVLLMERIMLAMQADDKEECTRLKNLLDQQAPI